MCIINELLEDLEEAQPRLDLQKLDPWETILSIIPNAKLNRKILSPLRDEKNPSFTFKFKNGKLLYSDWSAGLVGDWIDFLQKYWNCSFKDVIENLEKNVTLPSTAYVTKQINRDSKPIVYTIEPKDWTDADAQYWSKYGITKAQLIRQNVVSVRCAFINNNMFAYAKNTELMYAYKVGDRYKLYCPDKFLGWKWKSNATKYHVFGLEALKHIPRSRNIIITSSLKDMLVCEQAGINAIAPMSENSMIPESVILELYKTYEHIFVLMDNDEAGVESTKLYKEKYPDIIPVYLQGTEKDISDSYVKNSENTISWLKTIINQFNN